MSISIPQRSHRPTLSNGSSNTNKAGPFSPHRKISSMLSPTAEDPETERTLVTQIVTPTNTTTTHAEDGTTSTSQPPSISSSGVSPRHPYIYHFVLPYYENPGCVLTRFVLSRGEEKEKEREAKEKEKEKEKKRSVVASTAVVVPPGPLANDAVEIKLSIRDAINEQQHTDTHTSTPACIMMNIYPLQEWKKADREAVDFHNKTSLSTSSSVLQTLVSIVSGDGVVVPDVPLLQERSLLVEVLLHPRHKGATLTQWEQQRKQARYRQHAAINANAPLPSPSTQKKKKEEQKKNSTIQTPSQNNSNTAIIPLGLEEEKEEERLLIPVTIVSPSSVPVIVAVDVTSLWERNEMKQAWERQEPGRAKRARANREQWLMEHNQQAETQHTQNEASIIFIPSHPKTPPTLVPADTLEQYRQQRYNAQIRMERHLECIHELRRLTHDIEAGRITEAEEKYQQWRQIEQVERQHEREERELLRLMQLTECAQMKVVSDLIQQRGEERQKEKEKEQERYREIDAQRIEGAGKANTETHTDKRGKEKKEDSKRGRAAGARTSSITSLIEGADKLWKASYLARIESVLSPLLNLPPSRLWRSSALIEQARQDEREEVKREVESSRLRLDRAFQQAAENQASAEQEQQQQQQAIIVAAAQQQQQQQQLTSPLSTAADAGDSSKSSKSKQDKASEKAEKEKKDRLLKIQFDRERVEKEEQEEKILSWTALHTALELARSLRPIVSNAQIERLIVEGTEYAMQRLETEVSSVLQRMAEVEAVENEERQRVTQDTQQTNRAQEAQKQQQQTTASRTPTRPSTANAATAETLPTAPATAADTSATLLSREESSPPSALANETDSLEVTVSPVEPPQPVPTLSALQAVFSHPLTPLQQLASYLSQLVPIVELFSTPAGDACNVCFPVSLWSAMSSRLSVLHQTWETEMKVHAEKERRPSRIGSVANNNNKAKPKK